MRILGSGESLENRGILYVFPVFQTARMGKKDHCSTADELFRVSQARFAKQVQFLYVPAAVNTQLLSYANAASGRGKKPSKVGKDESCSQLASVKNAF